MLQCDNTPFYSPFLFNPIAGVIHWIKLKKYDRESNNSVYLKFKKIYIDIYIIKKDVDNRHFNTSSPKVMTSL